MEQKSQQQTTVTIKEEITDNTCSVKENNNIQRSVKMTLKGTKESVDGVECQMKLERNSPPGTHFQNTVSSKNTNNLSSSLMGSAILKTALTNFTTGNGNSADALISPPGAVPSSANTMNTEFEQSALPLKSLVKVKRLLSTLLQFANTLNVDAAESVKTLIFNLACNVISIEEFHSSLQEATNFPLRPFVLPFLRNYIPLLQKEISTQAKLAKQNIHQYVRQHETCVLEPFSPTAELSEVFNQTETVSSSNQSENSTNILSRKRHYECVENNVIRHKADSPTDLQIQTPPPNKKAASLFPPVNGSAFATSSQQSSVYNSEYFQALPPPFLSTSHNWLPVTSLPSSKDNNFTSEERKNGSDNEWNNIYVMLNCILSMVEKTKRALSILQERNAADGEGTVDGLNLNGFSNEQNSLNFLNRRTAEDVKRTANELMAHTVRLTEERVAFVRRKAEEAVNEVKRQAIAELQKAIAATDYKISDFASSHFQNKGAATEIKKPLISNPEHEFTGHNGFHIGDKVENSAFSPLQKNNCWNCGRKAQETCSGCNLARYCGSFCQHKDWESHHQICNVYANSTLVNSEKSVTRPTYADSLLRTSNFGDLLSKGVSSDLTNSLGLRSQSNSSEMNKLLPFSLNMTATSTEKMTPRTTNSRPLTPIATTTSTVNSSLNGSKVKK